MYAPLPPVTVVARLTLVFLLAGLPAQDARATDTAASTRPPNLVVIFCDNLGYGDVEPFGSTVHRTPQLNRMAREGMKFTHHYAGTNICTPSRCVLMTGLSTAHSQVRGNRQAKPFGQNHTVLGQVNLMPLPFSRNR